MPREVDARRRPAFVVGDTGEGERFTTSVRPAENRGEIAGGRRDLHIHWLQPRTGVVEKCNLPSASGADDQIFLAVAVEIDPGDTRTELAEGVGQQGLTAVVVVIRFDVLMATKLG